MNNTFGDKFRLTIFGASHADEVGVVVEGVPKGMHLTADMFEYDLARRRPALHGETARHEADVPVIEGLDAECVTTGSQFAYLSKTAIYARRIIAIFVAIHALHMQILCSVGSMARGMTLQVEVWPRDV